MDLTGLYNWAGSGTEIITGVANENLPSSEQNICSNEYQFSSGDFPNLSRLLIHVSLFALQQGGVSTMHKHDLRPYETLKVVNLPLQKVQVHVPANSLVGFHGMGVLRQANDEEERTLALIKSSVNENLHQSPNFDTDDFTSTNIAAAATTTVWTPAANATIGVYKITIAAAAAQTVELQFTDSVGANVEKIGLIRFASEGSFVYDFDTALMRNPNGNDGLLQAVTTTAAATQIDCIGHDILYSQ